MRALVFPVILFCVHALVLVAYIAFASRHKKSSTRPLRLAGRAALVQRDLDPEGFILLDGELWPARTRDGAINLHAGARVRVVGARGHTLEVEPLD